jgi:hypothetical protein
MLEVQIVAEMILKRRSDSGLIWNFINDEKLGAEVGESHLREYFELILKD